MILTASIFFCKLTPKAISFFYGFPHFEENLDRKKELLIVKHSNAAYCLFHFSKKVSASSKIGLFSTLTNKKDINTYPP
jgi:hypothetical protein